MSVELQVALIGSIATIAVAVIAAYATARKTQHDDLKDLKSLITEFGNRLVVTETKVDTLWEIYAEDAIRQARQLGMVASQSDVAPTEKWDEYITEELAIEIKKEAIEMCAVLHSPYDIAIELWHKHKREIANGDKEGVSVTAAWGTILVISQNAMAECI